MAFTKSCEVVLLKPLVGASVVDGTGQEDGGQYSETDGSGTRDSNTIMKTHGDRRTDTWEG